MPSRTIRPVTMLPRFRERVGLISFVVSMRYAVLAGTDGSSGGVVCGGDPIWMVNTFGARSGASTRSGNA